MEHVIKVSHPSGRFDTLWVSLNQERKRTVFFWFIFKCLIFPQGRGEGGDGRGWRRHPGQLTKSIRDIYAHHKVNLNRSPICIFLNCRREMETPPHSHTHTHTHKGVGGWVGIFLASPHACPQRKTCKWELNCWPSHCTARELTATVWPKSTVLWFI